MSNITNKKLRRKCIICNEKFETFDLRKKWCSNQHGYEYSMQLREKQTSKELTGLKQAKEKLQVESKTQTLQVLINKIVRAIDHDCTCISCGSKMTFHSRAYHSKNTANAGHFISVGSNNSLRFNMLNLYAQCVHCNKELWGNGSNYAKGLRDTFGDDILNYVLSLELMYPELKLMDYELTEAIRTAKNILQEVLVYNEFTAETPRNPELRIELRKLYNTQLNIYK